MRSRSRSHSRNRSPYRSGGRGRSPAMRSRSPALRRDRSLHMPRGRSPPGARSPLNGHSNHGPMGAAVRAPLFMHAPSGLVSDPLRGDRGGGPSDRPRLRDYRQDSERPRPPPPRR
jgi:hypothetical protein